MSLSDFWLSVIASIIASLLLALAAKFTLEKWKKIAIGLGALSLICTIGTVIVFSAITVTKEVSDYRARSALQDKIDAYTRGHYPVDYDKGYRLEVTQIGERPFLAFMYPDDVDSSAFAHPWSNHLFAQEIQKLLNDNGFAGAPAWAYQVKPLTDDQVQQLMKRKLE